MSDNQQMIPDEIVLNQIYYLRGQKVMLDRDLAKLYGVETKKLKQSVKRNLARFPSDFMFEMSDAELNEWRSQFVTSNADRMGLRYAPFCFTEQGVAMLSSVLNSEHAIAVNIQIIRVFTRLRQLYTGQTELLLEIERIKTKLHNQDRNMEIVFNYLDELSQKIEHPVQQTKPRKRMGFKPDAD